MNTIMKRMTAAIAVALTLLGISTPAMADETAPEMDETDRGRDADGGGGSRPAPAWRRCRA
jgi:hypothetical protein